MVLRPAPRRLLLVASGLDNKIRIVMLCDVIIIEGEGRRSKQSKTNLEEAKNIIDNDFSFFFFLVFRRTRTKSERSSHCAPSIQYIWLSLIHI